MNNYNIGVFIKNGDSWNEEVSASNPLEAWAKGTLRIIIDEMGYELKDNEIAKMKSFLANPCTGEEYKPNNFEKGNYVTLNDLDDEYGICLVIWHDSKCVSVDGVPLKGTPKDMDKYETRNIYHPENGLGY